MRQCPRLIGGVVAALALAACGPTPTDQAALSSAEQPFRPLALASPSGGSIRWDEATQRTYLAVPAHLAAPKTKPTATDRGFSKTNWSYSVKQQARVQVYIVQTPDWFEVVEQELPRHQKDFNRLEEAIAYANERYTGWPLVSLEP